MANDPKPSLFARVAGAVKSALANPLVQQAITAVILKKLAKRK